MPRAGYRIAAGFPAWLSEVYRNRALARGYSVADVRELAALVDGHPLRREVFRLSLPVMEGSTPRMLPQIDQDFLHDSPSTARFRRHDHLHPCRRGCRCVGGDLGLAVADEARRAGPWLSVRKSGDAAA